MIRVFLGRGIRLLACVLLALAVSAAQSSLPVPSAPNTAAEKRNLPARPQGSALFGLTVRSIEFSGAPELGRDRLLKHVAQPEGEALDRAKIQRSLRQLYRTGLFEDVVAEAQPAGDGVNVIFKLTRNLFVGNVDVVGLPKHGPRANQLVNASGLELGELFTEEKLQNAFDRMKRVMDDAGFFQATFTANEDPHPELQEMNVTFHVDPGPVAKVGQIIVEGSSGLSSRQVQEIAGMHTGKTVKMQMVTKALQRLKKHFQDQNRLEAQITMFSRNYVPESNTVDYTFSINSGPVVKIDVEGAKIRQGLLKRYVPVYEEGAVDNDLLNEGKRNLTDYFQTLGYFDAKLDFRRQNEPGKDLLRVIYTVDRGERHKLVEVTVQGNKYFPTDLIRERMSVQPAGWLLSHGRFSASLLARDLDSIRALYQTNGFPKVKVDGKVTTDVQDPEQLQVLLTIDEGPQVLVAALKIEGNSSLQSGEIRDLLSTIEGQPFSEVNMAQDRDSILNHYFNLGFPDVQFEASYEPDKTDPDKMDVTYTIKEGRRVYVNQVLVSGLENTRPHIVDREIQSKPKDPLSQSAMLESQRRLYDLGIFNEVDMAVQNPEGEAEQKNLLYQIKEAKRYTFNYGFGVEFGTGVNVAQGTSPQGQVGVSPRVSFDVTRINFRGRDQSIIFKSRLGALQQLALLSFDSPRFFDMSNWKWTVSGYYNNSKDVNTFTSQRLEFATQLEEKVNKSLTMLYRFSYRRVKASDFPPGFNPNNIENVNLYSQPVRVGMPSVAVLRDRRDDPIDATKGNYTLADLGVASNYFGSEANFGRIFIQNSTYHTFRKRFVFARSTRIGFETPYGKSTDVPLPERFFEGGSNSHRGFSINQAGPRDPGSGTPIGGNADFINNLELRLPPVRLPLFQQNLSFVVFHDMGNVYATGYDLWHNLFQMNQRNKNACRTDLENPNYSQVCDFNFLAHAVGGGIRYKTPIGPIRVDLGYNLNPAVFQVRAPETGSAYVDTMRRWNLFFSIGQTF